MAPTIGKCRLCLRDGVRLQDSHFIPAGLYRVLRDDKAKNPHPWLLTPNYAVQSSRQIKAHLLCEGCEQKFSGERWVLANCIRRDGSFPLESLLRSKTPVASSPRTRVYYAAQVPEINTRAIAYFAVSMFWRGSIHHWKDDGSVPYDLGPFQEQFRAYLDNSAGFPRDCALLVAIRTGKEVNRVTFAPIGERKDSCHAYKFPMPGLGLSVAVGRNIPRNVRNLCLVNGPGNPIVATSIIDDAIMQDAFRLRPS